ncbi:MAG TPA: SpoIIE family protein phosphatase [bacterium]|nr:SpoIIE family protein phosphatase [bacterium]HOL48730.1 SpoIIE family protein phosphatase [bacterium]HPQ20058.1 SpoIIE family protein phosphatase [bacterium]
MEENYKILNEVLLNSINELSAIYHFANEVINLETFDELFNLVEENITKIIGFKRYLIYLLNKNKNLLELVKTNLERSLIFKINHFKFKFNIKQPFYVVVTGEAKLFNKNNVFEVDKDIYDYLKSDNFVAVPLKTKKDIIGLIIADNNNEEITTEKFDTLKLLANVISLAIENINLKRNLKIAQNDLYAYLDLISRQYNLVSLINKAKSKEKIYEIILNNLKDIAKLDYILILNKNYKIIKSTEPIENINLTFSDDENDAITKAIKEEKIFNIDLESGWYGNNVDKIKKHFSINHLIILPIVGRQLNSGIFIGLKKEEYFKSEEFDELRMFINQAAIALENEDLYEKMKIMNDDLTNELKTAGEIQQNLLKKIFNEFDLIKLQAINIPAISVGGDFYFLEKVDNDRYFIAIGDVSGHGAAAALIMSFVMAVLNDEIKHFKSLIKVIENLNSKFISSFQKSDIGFITLFSIVIDNGKKEIYYVNAGHNYPYYYDAQNKKLFQIQKSGFFIGISEELKFEEFTIPFKSNDILILYTDGITEALNDKNELYGEKRFEEVLHRNIDKNIIDLQNEIIQELKEWTKKTEQNDDWTMVLIKF